MDVSENSGTPKSSILIGFSMVFHYKRSVLGYPYFWKPPNNPCWFVTAWTPHRVAGKHVKFSWVLSRLEMRKHFMITPWFKWQSRHPRKSRYKPGKKNLHQRYWSQVWYPQKTGAKAELVVSWVGFVVGSPPPPSNSHRQDEYIFRRESL